MELNKSVAVITGGASGIGEAIARDLAKNGVKVVLGDMNAENLDKVAAEIKAAGGEVATCVCNVTSDEDTAKLMDLAVSTFGQINIVVPSAGIIKDGLMISTDKETGKVKRVMSTDNFKAVIDVNLVGSFITMREAASRMVDGGWDGVLIPISSVNKVGAPGQMNYASTKSAISIWPKIMVGEFQMKNIKNVRVVAIAPGYVGTPMVKGMNQKALDGILSTVHMGRLIEPSEIADLVMHIATNEALDGSCLEITAGCITSNLAK